MVVAIAPVDVLLCILIAVAAVDDVGITPEVLVEGVFAVLEVAKQVFVSSGVCCSSGKTIDSEPVRANDVLARVSIEEGIAYGVCAPVNAVVSRAPSNRQIGDNVGTSPDPVVACASLEDLFLVVRAAVACDEIFSRGSLLDIAVHVFIVPRVLADGLIFRVIGQFTYHIVSLASFHSDESIRTRSLSDEIVAVAAPEVGSACCVPSIDVVVSGTTEEVLLLSSVLAKESVISFVSVNVFVFGVY